MDSNASNHVIQALMKKRAKLLEDLELVDRALLTMQTSKLSTSTDQLRNTTTLTSPMCNSTQELTSSISASNVSSTLSPTFTSDLDLRGPNMNYSVLRIIIPGHPKICSKAISINKNTTVRQILDNLISRLGEKGVDYVLHAAIDGGTKFQILNPFSFHSLSC
jgi:hypothetical protein